MQTSILSVNAWRGAVGGETERSERACHNPRLMVTDRSVPGPLALILAPILVVGSWIGMTVAVTLAAPALGLRPGLIVAELVLALPAVALTRFLHRKPAEALGIRGLAPLAAGLAALCGVTLWAASLGLMELQSSFWAPPPGYLDQFRHLHDLLRPNGVLDGLVSLAAIALAPAICEELLFRGTVLPMLQRPFGAGAALVVSACLFGMIHLDTIQRATGPEFTLYRVPFALAVGIGLGLLRVRTGSLVTPILAHCTLNSITLTLAPWVDDPLDSAQAGNPWLGLALIAGGTLATYLLLRVLARRASPASAPA